MTEITVIMSPENFNNSVIKKVSEKYCPPDNFYVMQEGYPTLSEVLKKLQQVVSQNKQWEEKYENVMAGLRYWKEKALEKDVTISS